MKSKKDALAEIGELAQKYHLTQQEIIQACREHNPGVYAETIMKIFSKLGGIFLLAGIFVSVALFWQDMNSLARVLITLAPGVLLYLFAFTLPAIDKKYDNWMIPLFLLSAIFQPLGLFIAVSEYVKGTGPDAAGLLVFGVMLLQQIIIFLTLRRTIFLFTSLIFGTILTLTGLIIMDVSDNVLGLVTGSLLLITTFFIDKTRYRAIASFWYMVGSLLFLGGFFDLVQNSKAEVVFLLAGIFVLYLSTWVKNKTLLFTSTFSILLYIGYFANSHFVDSSLWPIALIVLGLVCFGVGIMTLKISKKYM